MDYNLYLNNYFKKRTKDLQKYFKKFSFENEKHTFPNILSLLYFHTIDNLDKIKPIIERDEYHYYAIRFIYNQRNWRNSNYNSEIKEITNHSEVFDTYDTFDDDSDDEYHLKNQMEYDERSTKLKLGLNNLDYYEKILFNKYFVENKSLRKIGNEVGLSHAAIFGMVKKIKNKIINTPI